MVSWPLLANVQRRRLLARLDAGVTSGRALAAPPLRRLRTLSIEGVLRHVGSSVAKAERLRAIARRQRVDPLVWTFGILLAVGTGVAVAYL